MNDRYLLRFAGVLLAALAALTLILTWRAVLSAYSPLPFWDQWEEVVTNQYLAHLFSAHNEHRIAIPRLFFAIDSSVFGGRNLFLLAAIQLIQALHAAALIWVARRAGVRGPALALIGALVVALLFSGAQIENFYWGFQVQFVLVYLLATITFILALLGKATLWRDAGAVAFGIAAALCLSAGLLVLPACAVFLVLMRAPVRRIVIYAATGILIWVAYFQGGILSSAGSEPGATFSAPLNILYYAFVFLGGPLRHLASSGPVTALLPVLETEVRAAALTGLAGLSLALLAGLIVLVRHGPRARFVLLAICGLVVVVAVMTGAGRWELGAEQALSSRYATPVFLFWASLGALYWSLSRQLPRAIWRTTAQSVLTLTFFIVVILALTHRGGWTDLARAQGDRLERAESAVLTGVRDDEILAGIYPSPQKVMEQAAVLREAGNSVFASGRDEWIGQTLDSIADRVDPSQCLGVIDERRTVGAGQEGEGVRATGWVFATQPQRPVNEILLVSGSGEVRGYGQRLIDRPDVMAAEPVVTDIRSGWLGHTRSAEGETIVAYAILDEAGGRLAVCEFARR